MSFTSVTSQTALGVASAGVIFGTALFGDRKPFCSIGGVPIYNVQDYEITRSVVPVTPKPTGGGYFPRQESGTTIVKIRFYLTGSTAIFFYEALKSLQMMGNWGASKRTTVTLSADQTTAGSGNVYDFDKKSFGIPFITFMDTIARAKIFSISMNQRINIGIFDVFDVSIYLQDISPIFYITTERRGVNKGDKNVNLPILQGTLANSPSFIFLGALAASTGTRILKFLRRPPDYLDAISNIVTVIKQIDLQYDDSVFDSEVNSSFQSNSVDMPNLDAASLEQRNVSGTYREMGIPTVTRTPSPTDPKGVIWMRCLSLEDVSYDNVVMRDVQFVTTEDDTYTFSLILRPKDMLEDDGAGTVEWEMQVKFGFEDEVYSDRVVRSGVTETFRDTRKGIIFRFNCVHSPTYVNENDISDSRHTVTVDIAVSGTV